MAFNPGSYAPQFSPADAFSGLDAASKIENTNLAAAQAYNQNQQALAQAIKNKYLGNMQQAALDSARAGAEQQEALASTAFPNAEYAMQQNAATAKYADPMQAAKVAVQRTLANQQEGVANQANATATMTQATVPYAKYIVAGKYYGPMANYIKALQSGLTTAQFQALAAQKGQAGQPYANAQLNYNNLIANTLNNPSSALPNAIGAPQENQQNIPGMPQNNVASQNSSGRQQLLNALQNYAQSKNIMETTPKNIQQQIYMEAQVRNLLKSAAPQIQSVQKFTGLVGQYKGNQQKAISYLGGEQSPDYINYQLAKTQTLPIMANEIRRLLGSNPSNAENKTLEAATAANLATASPQQVMSLYENLNNILNTTSTSINKSMASAYNEGISSQNEPNPYAINSTVMVTYKGKTGPILASNLAAAQKKYPGLEVVNNG